MNICIVGVGAIGCWIAAQLSLAGEAVTLVARGAARETIERDGLGLDTPKAGSRQTAAARVVSSASDAADCDTFLLTLKAHQVGDVIASLAPHIAGGACIASLQNGLPWWLLMGAGRALAGDEPVLRSVDPDGTLAAAAGAASIVGGVLYVAADLTAPGHVHLTGKGKIVLGEAAGGASTRVGELAALFRRCDIGSEVASDIRVPIWEKLVRNAAFNPLSVLVDATMGEIAVDPLLQRVAAEVMNEVRSVAAAWGVAIDDARDEALATAAKHGTHKTSMLQDFEKGRRLELGAITASVLELADRRGVPVPHLRTVHACAVALDRRGSQRHA